MDLNEAKKRFYEKALTVGIKMGSCEWAGDWGFKWINARRRLGCCYYGKQMFGFSRQYALKATPEEMDLTFAHELAHALTKGHGHDYVWKRKCIELGGDGKRCSVNATAYQLREHGWEVSCANNCFTPMSDAESPNHQQIIIIVGIANKKA
jgi:hypothetical protein